ncbi:MAG: hypothetical protein P8N40_05150 [Gammaproteobacteria bacterium]|nr:hypothetical protein [Gammaproteobacteria bacterium]
MNLEKSLMAAMVLIAIAASVVTIPYSALILLLLGIVSSIMSPVTEIVERTAYLIVAVAAPNAADNLNEIPMIGEYLNTSIDGIAIAAAGMWVASFTIALINRIKP